MTVSLITKLLLSVNGNDMNRKMVIVLILAAVCLAAAISAAMQIMTKRSLARIGELEAECMKQYSETDFLKTISDRDDYLSQMEMKLETHRKDLFIQKMNKATDGIYITLYSGVHYVISPPVEGMY